MLKEPELEGLKCEIRSIEGPVMKDFGHFRKKIEEAGQKHEGASKRVVDLDARLVEVAAQVGTIAFSYPHGHAICDFCVWV